MIITIKNAYKSLPAGLKITDLPDFTIITGENGSGKTQLLNYIKSQGLDGIATHQINHVPSDWKAMPQNRQNRQALEKQILNQSNAFLDYCRNRKTTKQPNEQYESYINEIAQTLKKSPKDLSIEEIENNIPPDLQNQLLFEQDFIRLFIAWRNDYDSQCGAANRKGNQKKLNLLRKRKDPWDIINELFVQYNFNYRLVEPPPANVPFDSLKFKHKNDNKLIIGFADLSSGEQMIASLMLWSHNPNSGKRYKLLLLDEPDAFLHPSMSKILIKIISEKLVKDYKIKVIMATHSPSSVAFAPEKSIYVMQKETERFKKESKASAISLLSDGMIAFSNETAEESIPLLYKIQQSEKPSILLTEGIHDVEHLSHAINTLGIDQQFEILPLDGADKLKDFLVSMPSDLFGNKKIIALFDHDEKGMQKIKSLNGKQMENHKNCYSYRQEGNRFYMSIPVPHEKMFLLQNCALEMLYPLSILKENNMVTKLVVNYVNSKLEEQFSSEQWTKLEDHWCYGLIKEPDKKSFAQMITNFGKETFSNFNPLFEQIDYLINNS